MGSQGRLIVITGPSGVGKGTLVRELLQRHPKLHLSVSITTRSPRPGEVEGEHYYFVTRDRFEQMIERGELLEWAEFAGNYYGTPRLPVEQRIQNGESVLLEIELVGARQIRERFPQAQQIFIRPPSMVELERRLRKRDQDSDEAIARRLKRAKEEIDAANEFDFELVNDNLDEAIKQLENVLFAMV
ncbi:MAG: guanylate kinase [Cyanobacteria bacterium J06592_8]